MIRTATLDDVERIAKILVEAGVLSGENAPGRIRRCMETCPDTCFVSQRGGLVNGVALCLFDGLYLFLRYFALAAHASQEAVGAALHQRLEARARELDALGVVVDASLSGTALYHRLGYQLPDAVFLVKKLTPAGGRTDDGAERQAGRHRHKDGVLRSQSASGSPGTQDPGETRDRIVPRLRRAYLSICRCGDAVFSPYGVTTDQYALMRIVQRTPGISQSDMGNDLFADANTISAMVSLLEERGMLLRKASRLDGRVRCLYLSRRGRALMRRLWDDWAPMRRQLRDCFQGETGQQALLILERVCGHMTAGRAKFQHSAKAAKPNVTLKSGARRPGKPNVKMKVKMKNPARRPPAPQGRPAHARRQS